MNVIIQPKVLSYLETIVLILFEKEYFSYLETAKQYIDDLLDDIKLRLHIKHHKKAPIYFEKYGKNMLYAGFSKNKRTTWYVFFNIYMNGVEKIYLIRYIANNHTIAQYL
jgi:hypothetical protein